MQHANHAISRRSLLAMGTGAVAVTVSGSGVSQAANDSSSEIVRPPVGKQILLSCKLGMISKEVDGKKLPIVDRLSLAKEAGFDGVDFDQAADFTPEQVRTAVRDSGVFVHNAINHAHWRQRLTSPNQEDRDQGRSNIEHCIRVSHAAGGGGVLIVVGRGSDGSVEAVEQRAREEIQKLLPLAAAMAAMRSGL